MSQKTILETIGTIENKEMLGPAGFKELVLEAFNPFPGFFGTTVRHQDKPNWLYAITRSKYTEEKVIRVIQKIKSEHDFKFDATPGMVTLYEMLNPCIRFKDLVNYEEVPAILKTFEDEGIEFMSNRNVEPFTGVLRVKKYFLLEVVSDFLFKDLEDPNIHYFSIPVQLRFNQFEKITVDIKQKLENPRFDAALGTMYRRSGMLDVIRIYDDKSTPERLDLIRKKYLEAINKLSK
jgi:hypothetical protein